MADALRPLVGNWVRLIQVALEHKRKQFGQYADECARFFDGPYDWLYSNKRGRGESDCDFSTDEMPAPSTRMSINKAAELVQLFGPALYHRNPTRRVTPRDIVPPAPMLYGDVSTDPQAAQMFLQQDQQTSMQADADRARADLMERYLNYTPTPLDLKTESRWAITEALIKGMGCMWTRLHQPPGSSMHWSGTFFDSVDNLVMDPDAETYRDIRWMARRRVRPCWEVEKEKGLKPGMLRGKSSLESSVAAAGIAASGADGDYLRKVGLSADLVVYWEIYSKMGLGSRLSGAQPALSDQDKAAFERFGDFCYLEVVDGCEYPLNLPPPLCDVAAGQMPSAGYGPPGAMPDMMGGTDLEAAVKEAVSWETPFWRDAGWPMTPLVFQWKPRQLWPVSHLRPAMGELKFLNWAWSFLAGKVRRASRDFIAVAKAAGQEIKSQIKHGPDYTIIEVEQIFGSIDKAVSFLQHPPFNPEIYKVIEAVTHNFERRTGLTELMYGLSARQMRSAEEARAKSDAVNVRPDDMANCVEDAAADWARKEALVARWHLLGADVVRVLGPAGAQAWEALIVPSDPADIIFGLEYRIEAGTARKPNKMLQQDNMNLAVQNLFQPLYQIAVASGNVGPINALITDWAKSHDLDAQKYLLPAPPPPQVAPAAGPGSPPGQGGQPTGPVAAPGQAAGPMALAQPALGM